MKEVKFRRSAIQAFVFFSAVFASTMVAKAQNYISAAPSNGFDFDSGTDYIVLYAPDEAIQKMGEKIKSNQNLDSTQVENQFYYWVTDWDKHLLTLIDVDRTGATNSYGGDKMLSITPLYAWGTGYFGANSTKYDLSMVDDDDYIHLGLCDFGGAASKYKFEIGDTDDKTNRFELEVNVDEGTLNGTFVGVGDIGHDGKWYNVDIPVKDLVDENGDFGFTYNWANPIANSFVFTFDNPTVSEYTKTDDPASDDYLYTVTKLNSAVSIDGVFFYHKNTTGITHVKSDAPEKKSAYYNLLGMQVKHPVNGIYVHNGKKVVIK